MADVTRIPGIASLWRITSGDPRVCVGVLDGPVNLAVPSFRGRRLRYVAGAPERPDGPALRHGTYTASLIFGDHSSAVKGLAPQCSGVLVPIFSDLDATTIRHCSQQDL